MLFWPASPSTEIARETIEAVGERIAQAVGVNLLDGVHAYERIIRGDAVPAVGGVVAVDVDPQEFAPDALEILGVAAGRMPGCDVVGGAAVAERDVKESIRPEAKGAAVVIGLLFVDPEDLPPAVRIDPVGIIGIDPPFGDHRLMVDRRPRRHVRDEIRHYVVVRLGRVGIDEWIVREIRMGRQAEQASFVVVPKLSPGGCGHPVKASRASRTH